MLSSAKPGLFKHKKHQSQANFDYPTFKSCP